MSRDASKEDIKKAYKKLAIRHHPDKGGDQARFQEITNAYNELTEEKPSMHGGVPFEHMFGGGGPGGPGMDFFSSFFGGPPPGHHHHHHHQHREQRRGPPPKERVQKTIHISMQEAYAGVTKTLNIQIDDNCDKCTSVCQRCGGDGYVIEKKQRQMGHTIMIQQQTVLCNACTKGTAVTKQHCNACGSARKVKHSKQIKLDIPPGTLSNAVFEFDEVVPRHAIHLVIVVRPMPGYKMSGLDLEYEQHISLQDSVCGTKVHVPHPSNEVVEIDTATMDSVVRDGMRVTVPNKGMTHRGALHVVFRVDYPERCDRSDPKSTEELRTLLSKLCMTK